MIRHILFWKYTDAVKAQHAALWGPLSDLLKKLSALVEL